MATYYYYDFDLPIHQAGGTGTELNPYTYCDFSATVQLTASNMPFIARDGDILMCKGSVDLGSEIVHLIPQATSTSIRLYIDNWNPSVNGPWRIKTSGASYIGRQSGISTGYLIFKNGIFDFLGDLTLYTKSYFANVFLKVAGNFYMTSTANNTDLVFLGCTVIHTQISSPGWIQESNGYSDSLSAVFQDTIIDGRMSGDMYWVHKFDNCVTTKIGPSVGNALIPAAASLAQVNNIQFEWTKPHPWPDPYAATQADLQYSIEGVGITVSGSDKWN